MLPRHAFAHISSAISMIRTALLAAALVACTAGGTAVAATPVHKCVINGSVTFQRDPCPAGKVQPAPNLERLNAEEKKRREAAGARAAERPTAPATPAPPTATAAPMQDPAPGALPAAPATAFRCDGRTHCSQMKSCAEAKYFLAQCPGVKMDGDRNGIPCEQQWCNR
jgi:Excalibur calcium-binding domain